MRKLGQLVSWRRIGIDHVYAEYKDPDYVPPKGHGARFISVVMRIYEYELRHGMVQRGDENGHNYQQTNDVETLFGHYI